MKKNLSLDKLILWNDRNVISIDVIGAVFNSRNTNNQRFIFHCWKHCNYNTQTKLLPENVEQLCIIDWLIDWLLFSSIIVSENKIFVLSYVCLVVSAFSTMINYLFIIYHLVSFRYTIVVFRSLTSQFSIRLLANSFDSIFTSIPFACCLCS